MTRPGAWRTTPRHSRRRHPADRVDKSYGLFGPDSDSNDVRSRGDHKTHSLAALIPIRPSLDTYPVSSDPSDLSKSSADRVDKSSGLFGPDNDSNDVRSRGDHKTSSLAATIPIPPSDLSKSKSQGPWAVESSG